MPRMGKIASMFFFQEISNRTHGNGPPKPEYLIALATYLGGPLVRSHSIFGWIFDDFCWAKMLFVGLIQEEDCRSTSSFRTSSEAKWKLWTGHLNPFNSCKIMKERGWLDQDSAPVVGNIWEQDMVFNHSSIECR